MKYTLTNIKTKKVSENLSQADYQKVVDMGIIAKFKVVKTQGRPTLDKPKDKKVVKTTTPEPNGNG